MKKISIPIIALLFLAAVSCKKTDNSGSTSTDQMATVAAGGISFSSIGLASASTDVAANAGSTTQACGSTVTDTLTKSNSANGVSSSFFLRYVHTLTCNASNQHDNIAYTANFNGHYENANINSLDTGSATFKVAGFTTNATAYVINGEYKRNGKFTMKTGTMATGTSFLDILVTNLTVDKTTKNVTGGTATFTGSITTGGTTTPFSGPVTFGSNGTASITINGTTYTLNLNSGVITKS